MVPCQTVTTPEDEKDSANSLATGLYHLIILNLHI